MDIKKPTLVIDQARVIKNIQRMKEKIDHSSEPIRFRPHFKTHQSHQVGQWLREQGIEDIAVSSIDMAYYFYKDGWQDITLAILANPLQIEAINDLSSNLNLNLLVDSKEMVAFLKHQVKQKLKIWIKIDTGYHRTGIQWDQTKSVYELVKMINSASELEFIGFLTHSGHSYHAGSVEEIERIYHDTVSKLNQLKKELEKKGIYPIEISIGDTPTCSVMKQFYGVSEIRCGNFVYYDLMQLFLGACREEDIAATVACPVIAKYPQRNEIVIYGGAIHLSKESLPTKDNHRIFGFVALPKNNFKNWGNYIKGTFISSLSQEHGIIKTNKEFIQQVKVGDILMILPVHSCLAVHCLGNGDGALLFDYFN